MTSKHIILLHNTEFGYHNLSILHSHELFNRQLMANLLEAIENKTYNYDDIININITNLLEINRITDLPKKLKFLEIKNTSLEELIIPEQCIDITSIIIKDSNIQRIPEIHFLTNLSTLSIENSNIRYLPSAFPPSLQNINLNNNLLNESNCDLTRFPKNVSVILFKNNFQEKKLISGYNFCYGSQHKGREFNRITNYTIQRNNAQNIIQETLHRERDAMNRERDEVFLNFMRDQNNFILNNFDMNMEGNMVINNNLNIANPRNALINNYLNRANPRNTVNTSVSDPMFNSTQTVHITSICNSVTKSIQKIITLTDKIYKRVPQEELINEFMNEFYNTNDTNNSNTKKSWYNTIINFFSGSSNTTNTINRFDTQDQIKYWIRDPSKHTKTNMQYSELLARVWILIDDHKQKQDFITNVKIELKASIGMCFTGRINRLVNSLIGFIDGITVGISIKEQLQIEIGKIIAKLGKQEIKYKEAVKQIRLLFDDPDVLEDETVTTYYKDSWLDALDDYKPENDEEEQKEEDEKEYGIKGLDGIEGIIGADGINGINSINGVEIKNEIKEDDVLVQYREIFNY